MRYKVGDLLWSDFFRNHIVVTSIKSDTQWKFRIVTDEGMTEEMDAQTPLSQMRYAK